MRQRNKPNCGCDTGGGVKGNGVVGRGGGGVFWGVPRKKYRVFLTVLKKIKFQMIIFYM